MKVDRARRIRQAVTILAVAGLGGCATPRQQPPAATAGAKDQVRIVGMTPSKDALLAAGERVHVSVEYHLDSREGAFLLIRPYRNDVQVDGYRAHVGIPVFRGEGFEQGWIEFDTVADVSEIRATLTEQRSLAELASDALPVDLRWRQPGVAAR